MVYQRLEARAPAVATHDGFDELKSALLGGEPCAVQRCNSTVGNHDSLALRYHDCNSGSRTQPCRQQVIIACQQRQHNFGL